MSSNRLICFAVQTQSYFVSQINDMFTKVKVEQGTVEASQKSSPSASYEY